MAFTIVWCEVESEESVFLRWPRKPVGTLCGNAGEEGKDTTISCGELLTWVDALEKVIIASLSSSSTCEAPFVFNGSRCIV